MDPGPSFELLLPHERLKSLPGTLPGAQYESEFSQKRDKHHPSHWPTSKKWPIISVYCLLTAFVASLGTSYASLEFLVQANYGGRQQIVPLGRSLFLCGNAAGAAFLCPLSDIAGRKWVYVGSILSYALLNIGLAFAVKLPIPLNLPVLFVTMLLTGAAGSTSLCNVPGTISDLFGGGEDVGQAMALFVFSAYGGASFGSPLGEWIGANMHMALAWLYWLNAIIGAAFALVMCFVSETLPPLVITHASKQSHSTDPQEVVVIPTKTSGSQNLRFTVTMAFRIFLTEPVVLSLSLFNAFACTLLSVYRDGLFDIFVLNKRLSYMGANLVHLNSIAGVVCMFLFVSAQPWIYGHHRPKWSGRNKPEARFSTSLVTVWGFPISLFWFALTSNGNQFWSPVLAGAVLEFSAALLWLSMLNNITDLYPNATASALAAFLTPSFLLTAAFSHLGLVIYDSMGTTWAMATLAFLSLGVCFLLYTLYFYGPKLRARSKMARVVSY